MNKKEAKLIIKSDLGRVRAQRKGPKDRFYNLNSILGNQ